MTTYLFIGLILVLAAFLVRQRRARAGGDGSPRPDKPQRVPLRPPRKGAPAPATAGPETAATTPPSAREPLPAPSREPLAATRPAPLADPAMSWTPEDTIVEPGWPLPGEIAGGWAAAPASPGTAQVEASPFPDGAAAPVAVLEWERPASAPAAEVDVDDLPAAEEWAMPPFDADAPLDAPAGPPLWLPADDGAETTPASGDETPQPVWADESAAAVSQDIAPPAEIAWGSATQTVADPEPAPVAGPPEGGLVWADEAPQTEAAPPWEPEPSPAWEPAAVATDEPVAEEPASESIDEITSGEPAPTPAPDTWIATPLAEADAIASFTPVAATPLAVDPGDAAPTIDVPGFGAVTPAPVWPPDSAAETLPEPAGPPAWIPEPVAEEFVAEEPVEAPAAPALYPAPTIPFTRICDRLGVTPRMLALMRMLAETPRSITEQARELGVSRPLIADLCTRMEITGLATREPVPSDRRRVVITLTDAGLRLCEETADITF